MRECSAHLISESVIQAGEEATSPSQDDIAHQHLAQLDIIRAQRIGYQSRDRFREILIGLLGNRSQFYLFRVEG